MALQGGHFHLDEGFSLVLEDFVFFLEYEDKGVWLLREEGVFVMVDEVDTGFDVVFDDDGWLLVFVFFLIIEQSTDLLEPDDSVDDDFFIWDFLYGFWILFGEFGGFQLDLQIVGIDDSKLWWFVVDGGVVGVKVVFLF